MNVSPAHCRLGFKYRIIVLCLSSISFLLSMCPSVSAVAGLSLLTLS